MHLMKKLTEEQIISVSKSFVVMLTGVMNGAGVQLGEEGISEMKASIENGIRGGSIENNVKLYDEREQRLSNIAAAVEEKTEESLEVVED